MDQSRRQILRTFLGASASFGMAAMAGCRSRVGTCASSGLSAACSAGKEFYVICHGMMLFQIMPPDRVKDTKGSLVLLLPNVPPSGSGGSTDLGHIYRVASRALSKDAYTLATPSAASSWDTAHYSLEGVDDCAGIKSVKQMDATSNVWLDSAGCNTQLTGDQPLVRIVLPLPMCYKGWRSVRAYKTDTVLKSQKYPGKSALPKTFFMTHIFIYSSSQQPVLRQNSDSQVWPNANTNDATKLHVFAQPECPKPSDHPHADHLHMLFCPKLDITVETTYCISEAHAGDVGPGFVRDDLIDWNDKSEPKDDICVDPAHPFDRSRVQIQPTNCRSYGYGG